MSTRRSPRLTGPSPKPELPPKPRPPKRVKDVAADSVRQANFQAELAEWEAAKLEHANLMKIRKAKKTTAWKAASKSAAEAEAPPPAAPPAAPAPPPQLSADELRLSSPALAERSQAAAVVPLTRPQEQVRHPRLRRSVAKWLLDVEAVAERCGAGRAQLLRRDGFWFDPDDWEDDYETTGKTGKPSPHPAQNPAQRACACCCAGYMNMMDAFHWEGGYPTITAEQRALHRRRLEGLGEEPSLEELGEMMWPQRAWWEDRDRIGECQSL